MTDSELPGDMVSTIDQLSGIAAQIASVVAYYASVLDEQGVEPSLVATLTQDFHNRLWNAILDNVQGK